MTVRDDREILDRRLTALHLPMTTPRFETPEAVVGWFGAVQSQDFGPAKWSVAQRMDGAATDATLDRAFDAGRILRTHVLRPTWHFVTPEDIRWLVELTGPPIVTAPARLLTRDESLAELTRRYFASHGPATVKDFRVWCSLPAADARRGLELVGSELHQETFRDLTLWSGPAGRSDGAVVDPSPTVHLVQGYDESIMG